VVRTIVAALGALVVLTGCTGGASDQLAEVPTTRAPAAAAVLKDSSRCPSSTVLLSDEEPASGAGAIPAGFDGRVVLRCEVDHTTMTSQDEVDRYAVRQWQGALSPELHAALALPDREYRSRGVACGSSAGGTTALYIVDAGSRAIRVLPPKDGPCHDLRPEVAALLPDTATTARETFHVSRRAG
jgi:hypothetical protein